MKGLKYKISGLKIVFMVLSVILYAGCRSESTLDLEAGDENSEIYFTGVVGSTDEIQSRANNDIYDISSSYYKCNFFINVMERVVDEDTQEIKLRQKPGKYYIPSGSSGSLIPADNQLPLNWFSRKTPHYFWGFSIPWDENYGFTEEELKNGKDFSEGIKIPFKSTRINQALTGTPSVITESNWEAGCWRNGRILEQFLGGLTGPFTYLDNGAFVQLRFRHLISKVYIKNFAVVDNITGTVHSGLKGEMTIYGLPNEAIFYPCPVDEEGMPQQPYVEIPKNWGYDKSNEVVFAITNSKYTYESEGHTGNYDSNIFYDSFYFPPDVDFRNLSFKIEIYEYVNGEWRLSTTHGNHGAYYGDFSKVIFTRPSSEVRNNNYDNPDDSDENYKLHAGEYLTLNINLYEKGEPSLRGTITAWNDFQGRDASQHIEDGIYSIDELKEFSSVMSSSADSSLRDEFYETHNGGTTADDTEGEYPEYPSEKKVIKLYDDIGSTAAHSSTSTNKMSSPLNVGDEYILDGQGHTVNINSSTINLGPVRDIYLRYYYYTTSTSPYTYTEYIVYIDKMGNVYTVDPETFEETPTGQNVNDMTTNPYSLNLATGTVS